MKRSEGRRPRREASRLGWDGKGKEWEEKGEKEAARVACTWGKGNLPRPQLSVGSTPSQRGSGAG